MVYKFELGFGLSICIGFILVIRKLKLKNYSIKNTENRISSIQSHQFEQKQTMSSSSSSSSIARRSNPLMRLIQGFTGSENTTQYEQLHDIEGEESGKQAIHPSAHQKSKHKPATVDMGSQVCQEIIEKRERRNRSEDLSEGEGTPREGFIQEIFHSSNKKNGGAARAMAAAATTVDNEKEESRLSAQYTCAICLEVLCLGNTNMTTTGCGHTFHFSCLLKSLRSKNLCPMCRGELEESRPKPQAPNVLTPMSAEQIITEEISYFPNAAHAHSITMSRHPKRRLKELLRVFGFTLLRSVAEYVHDENMPVGWYDDGESEDESSDEEETDNEEQDNDNEEQDNEEQDNDDNSTDNGTDNDDEFNYAGFVMDTVGQQSLVPIVGDLREHIHIHIDESHMD